MVGPLVTFSEENMKNRALVFSDIADGEQRRRCPYATR